MKKFALVIFASVVLAAIAGAQGGFKVRLLRGSAGAAVHQAALEYDADLIVTGRVAGNQAYSIIREAPCPVISI